MIPQRVYLNLIKSHGFKPKRVDSSKIHWVFPNGQPKIDLTFENHENFIARFPMNKAYQILEEVLR